ncbi:MAG TPA: HAD family hydrolase [Clostridia bacterium]|nr:HAD family hydrolase [Clostridia bacterium]
MGYKAVIFDLDGTLLDTIDDLGDSMNSVLAQHGYPVHDLKAYKYFVGNGMRNLVLRALPEEKRDASSVEQGLGEMRGEYAKRWANKTRPYPGIPQLLDALTEKGIKLAVLSNKLDKFSKDIVKELLPAWNFYPVYGEREGVPIKPDPAGALEIAGILEVAPADILYLGDTGVDMKTAVSAGMYAVGVLWGFRNADELTGNGANLIISDPLEVLKLL